MEAAFLAWDALDGDSKGSFVVDDCAAVVDPIVFHNGYLYMVQRAAARGSASAQPATGSGSASSADIT